MDKLIKLIKSSKHIYIAGNGGSASTAEHLTTDLIKKLYPAICLSSNTSVITMLANDYGYSTIFSKQLEILADENDLLITISCSGTSPSIINAQTVAKDIGAKIYVFETFKTDRDYAKLENRHLQFAHEVANAL